MRLFPIPRAQPIFDIAYTLINWEKQEVEMATLELVNEMEIQEKEGEEKEIEKEETKES